MQPITALSGLTELDDPRLARAVVEGHHDALEEIYRRHSGAIYGLALRLTRSPALAEDVAQEVFVRLWRKPGAYDPERGSLRSFLLAHTHGRAIDLIRSESSRRTREEKDEALATPPPPSTEEEVMDLHSALHVRAALAKLAANERIAIEMAYFRGCSYREVANLLDEPEGTIKSRIRAGLKRLHHQLSVEGVTP